MLQTRASRWRSRANLLLRSRDGRQRLIALTAAPIRGHGGQIKGVVTIFRDSTSEKKREEELQKASRLESVALLAGGIAHDFNNILTAILGHIALAKNHATSPETLIAAVEKGCLYATDLTRQLLSFAKGSVAQPARGSHRGDRARERRVRAARRAPELRLRPGRRPASRGGGPQPDPAGHQQSGHQRGAGERRAVAACGSPRTTSTSRASSPSAHCRPGNYVQLTIQDNGSGISPAHLSRIFDPYFTTKAAGSGLGLATAYSIIKKHDGLIRVESELGRGTTFFIYLPAHEARAQPVSGASDAAASPLSDGAAAPAASGPTGASPVAVPRRYILFMDDESVLQELVAAMLGFLGYEVVCVANGDEAIERFERARAENRPFAVVMVDLTIPGGMGGFETVQKLRAIDPQVKAVVSSGYSNDPVLANYRQHGFSGVIAKPYQMAELDRILRAVMDAPAVG